MEVNTYISIIVPYYNSEKHIIRSLKSILAQKKTCPVPFELILSNNNSTDKSTHLIEEFIASNQLQSNWKIVNAFEKQGAAYARNIALNEAKGEWIVLIDADDWIEEGYLAGLIFHSKKGDLLIAKTFWWNEKRNKIIERIKPNQFQMHYNFPSIIISGGTFIKKKWIVAAGGWNEEYRFVEDVELMCRIQLLGISPVYVETPTYLYTKENSFSINYAKEVQYGISMAKIYKSFYPIFLGDQISISKSEVRNILFSLFFRQLKASIQHWHWSYLASFFGRRKFFKEVRKFPSAYEIIAQKFDKNEIALPNIDDDAWTFWQTKVPQNTSFLTFDDGPHPQYTTAILDLLKTHKQKATFFVVGKRAERYPEIIKRIVAEGHELGNHTYSHFNLRELNFNKTLEEIEKTQQLLSNIVGENNAPKWFRSPYGITTGKAKVALNSLNIAWVRWSKETFDWKSNASAESIANIVKENGPQHIYDLHDDVEPHPSYTNAEASTFRTPTVEALELILQDAKRNDISYTTLSEIFGMYFKK
jgi:peptidoglycan/xylan/chitin deacetylase (PgdA/CDA1 family)/GT2 family glycosyltransferase